MHEFQGLMLTFDPHPYLEEGRIFSCPLGCLGCSVYWIIVGYDLSSGTSVRKDLVARIDILIALGHEGHVDIVNFKPCIVSFLH